MDRRYELQKHYREGHKYKKDERKPHEQWQEKRPSSSYRTGYAIIGVILFAITAVTVIASVVMLSTKMW